MKHYPGKIKKIGLWENNPLQRNKVQIVRIDFENPCSCMVLNIDELKQILRAWIQGEEIAYPPAKGFRGRWMLFDAIKEVFEDGAHPDPKKAFSLADFL